MPSPKNDRAFAESMRSEQHPDRKHPNIAENVAFNRALVIGCNQGHDLQADLFTPAELPREPRPAIVFLHGGSWLAGGPSQFHFHANRLADRYGFYALSVDYRLSDEAPFPAALQDAHCAMRWIRSQAHDQHIDPQRIVVAGGSAGAHLASMLITSAAIEAHRGEGGQGDFPSHANLAILFNGEYDMWDLVEKGSLLDAMQQFIGGTPDAIPHKYDELSSIQHVHADMPPVLLLHGTEDRCVSHEQSIAFHQQLLEHNVDSEIEIYEGQPHAWFNREPDRTTTCERMESFIASRFGLAPDTRCTA